MGIPIPFGKNIVNGLIKQGFEIVEKMFNDLKSKTDLDKDGKLDLKEEVPGYFNDLKECASEILHSFDATQLSRAVALASELGTVCKDAIDFDRIKPAVEKAKVAAFELFKLAGLAFAEIGKQAEEAKKKNEKEGK